MKGITLLGVLTILYYAIIKTAEVIFSVFIIAFFGALTYELIKKRGKLQPGAEKAA